MMKSLAKVAFALMLVTSAMGAGLAASSDSRISPSVSDAVGLTGHDVPDNVVRYGADANPGIFVTVESSDDIASLEQWANSSTNRAVEKRYPEDNTLLISAPMSDVGKTLTSTDKWLPGGEPTLMSLSYVSGLEFNTRVGIVDPVSGLDSKDSFQSPDGALWAEMTTSGQYSASAFAWDEDANETHISDVKQTVGAESVTANGEGVSIGVIDSGVNHANGTLFGNGTEGSEMRFGDAYDFVDDEPVDLSVSRSELPGQLDNISDPNGHGTWVASASVNAKSGIAPNATLHAYRALNSEGQGSTEDIRDAISRADAQGTDILIMSLGAPVFNDVIANELEEALSESGNVTAAYIAVGNSYTTTRYVSSPADVQGVIGVSATNPVNASTAKKAYFANTGPDTGLDGSGAGEENTRGIRPDTSAPGMKITTPVASEYGSVYDSTLSGTSMSTPISGAVGALVLDAKPWLKGQPTEFSDRMVRSGTHTPNIGVTESIGGMSNATRAINGWDTDASDRNLTDATEGRDAANRALAGDVGVKMSQISEWMKDYL